MNYAGDINILQSIFVVIIFFSAGLIYISFLKKHDRYTLTKIFTVAFVIRVIAVFALYYYMISVGGDGFLMSDDRKYDRVAKEIAYELSKGKVGYKQHGTGWANIGYFNFNGWLYSNFNFDTISARLVNAFLSAITVILFYLVFETVFDRKRAVVLGYTLALLPNLILWSSQQFKDTAIIFCSAVLLYILVCKFRYKIRIFPLIVFALFAGCLWFLRKDYIFPYLAVIILLVFLKYTNLDKIINSASRSTLPKIAIVGVFGISLLVGMLFTSAGSEFIGTLGQFSEGQHAVVSSGYGFSRYLRILSPADIYKLPAAVAFTAIAPLPSFSYLTDPVMVGSGIHSIANLGLVLGLPFVILGFFLFKDENVLFTDRLLLKWIPLMMLCALSIVYMGNMRYKAAILVYFACWASLAIYDRKRLKGKLLVVYGASLFLIVIIVPIAVLFR